MTHYSLGCDLRKFEWPQYHAEKDKPTMTYEEFKQLVYELRQMQKTWFRTHEQSAIIRSRQLEKRVDDVLEEEFNRQLKLF